MVHYIIRNYNDPKKAVELAEMIKEALGGNYASRVDIYDNGSEYSPVYPNVIENKIHQGKLWSYYNVRNLIDCPYVVFFDSGDDITTDMILDIETAVLRATRKEFSLYDPVALSLRGINIFESKPFVTYTSYLYDFLTTLEKEAVDEIDTGIEGYIMELIRYFSIRDSRGLTTEINLDHYKDCKYLNIWRKIITSQENS